VDPPFVTKQIGCKWVFKNKYKSYGSLEKKKERIVEKRFAQKEGIDYMRRLPPQQQNGLPSILYFPW
jgi:hypothetical protein